LIPIEKKGIHIPLNPPENVDNIARIREIEFLGMSYLFVECGYAPTACIGVIKSHLRDMEILPYTYVRI